MRKPGTGIALSLVVALAACNGDGLGAGGAPAPDLSSVIEFPPAPDAAVLPPDPCNDTPSDPAQHEVAFGPPDHPFALGSDANPDPLESDVSLARDINGYLVQRLRHPLGSYGYIPNRDDNGGAGTVSKIDSKAVREVARYPTVTCYSLPGGSTDACDGTRGCCSADDDGRYRARQQGQKEPGHQQVQLVQNEPSRTSIDFNQDLVIANQASGGQGSVTRIAADVSDCVDRNHSGRIDTSSDSSGDGFIQTDCNGDGLPDDIASVKARPCTNKLRQEYYGTDDECVLWTTNVLAPAVAVRALGLGAGAIDVNASDAWVGGQHSGQFVRLDGRTGLTKQDARLPPECLTNGPFGVALDAQGIAWAPESGAGKLCYFDTKNVANVGSVRDPPWGALQAWGLTLDRDQNVWVGGGVARYTPDRSNGFKQLGNGWWTQVTGLQAGGTGIAADSRSIKDYFLWACLGDGGTVLQIPGATIKVMKADQMVAGGAWPTITMPCSGVSMDSDQNIWGESADTITRALVDAKGKITQPVVNGPTKGNNTCPAGDSCRSIGGDVYSDNFGWRYIIGSSPQSYYSMLIPGCRDGQGGVGPTQWGNLSWVADVPPNTQLVVHAKAGPVQARNDPAWQSSSFTSDASTSPVCLQTGLKPNVMPTGPADAADGWLYVELVLKTGTQNVSATLKAFQVTYRCR